MEQPAGVGCIRVYDLLFCTAFQQSFHGWNSGGQFQPGLRKIRVTLLVEIGTRRQCDYSFYPDEFTDWSSRLSAVGMWRLASAPSMGSFSMFFDSGSSFLINVYPFFYYFSCSIGSPISLFPHASQRSRNSMMK